MSNRGLAEWLIRFGEQRKYGRGSPEARWNHVWMAVSDIEVIEAKGGGVRIAPYADYAQSFHTIFRPPYGPAGAELVAVNAMRAMLGERYGWLTIASEALIFATGTRIRFGIEGSQICVTGETLVSIPGLREVHRRWYQGPMIEVTTAGGRHLTVTPNHPILTVQGWRAAGLLKEGDQVVSDVLGQITKAANPDVNHMPARIKDVFDAVAEERSRVGVVSPKFNANRAIRDGQIEVIATHGQLGDGLDASLFEPASEFRFTSADAVQLEEACRGDRPHGFGASRATPESIVSTLDTSHSPLRAAALDGEVGALLVGAKGHTALLDHPRDSAAIDPIVAGQISGTKPLSVLGDYLVRVIRNPFRGHVYNLRTSTEWYLASGIVAHNCSGAVASALALAGVDMIPTSHMAIQPWLGEEWSSPADIAAVAREQRWLPVPR